MATATRGDVEDAVEMMPKGIFASEKCEPLGILNHDRNVAMMWSVGICGLFESFLKDSIFRAIIEV